MASFSVCILARETPDVLMRVFNHYRTLGAEQVRIFFDGEPNEVQIPVRDGLDLVVCDQAFWQRHLGKIPCDLEYAMRTVFRFAHESCSADWQFFCDADEFLVSAQPINEVLESLPRGADALRIMNVEAVWGAEDDPNQEFGCTHMRKALSRRQEWALRVMLPHRRRDLFRKGFLGHASGKTFLRKGAVIEEFSSHHAIRRGKPLGRWAHTHGWGLDQVALLHFDAVSQARWIEKWRRRLSYERPSSEMGAHRMSQLKAVSAAMQSETLPDLFRELYCATRYEIAVLSLFGGIQRRKIF